MRARRDREPRSGRTRVKRADWLLLRWVIWNVVAWLTLSTALILSQPKYAALPALMSAAIFVCIVISLVLIVRTNRMHSRLRTGICLKCRYEVGGLARCPECGTPVDDVPRGGAG